MNAMVYVCLKCGFWKVVSGLAEAFLQGFAQGTVSIQHICIECKQPLHAVTHEDKLHVIQSIEAISDKTVESEVPGA